ncbi:MAG: type II toxin-antitoxin system RelE/ParE family toxin [bacterium]
MEKNNLYGYKVQFDKKAKKQLSSLSAKIQDKILSKLEELIAEQNNLNIKKLFLCKNLYRIKCGDYRIVYEPLHNVIIVYIVAIDHRKKVYKYIEKLFLY